MAEAGGDVYYSIDTGLSENIFSNHYFDMNKRSHETKLYKLIRGKELKKLAKGNHSIIIRGANSTEPRIKEDL